MPAGMRPFDDPTAWYDTILLLPPAFMLEDSRNRVEPPTRRLLRQNIDSSSFLLVLPCHNHPSFTPPFRTLLCPGQGRSISTRPIRQLARISHCPAVFTETPRQNIDKVRDFSVISSVWSALDSDFEVFCTLHAWRPATGGPRHIV